MSELPPLESLQSREAFFEVVNTLFETAPPLADAMYTAREEGKIKTYDELIDISASIIAGLSNEDRIVVINAHPRIGINPATENVSSLSYKEQVCF